MLTKYEFAPKLVTNAKLLLSHGNSILSQSDFLNALLTQV